MEYSLDIQRDIPNMREIALLTPFIEILSKTDVKILNEHAFKKVITFGLFMLNIINKLSTFEYKKITGSEYEMVLSEDSSESLNFSSEDEDMVDYINGEIVSEKKTNIQKYEAM